MKKGKNMASSSSGTRKGGHFSLILVTALMLFSMFFGAGNLIFPPMLAAEAGTSFWPAVLGFLLTGVMLPVLGIVAIGITGHHLRDLATRAGVVFGTIFAILSYLSIGAFYALPRTGAVSYEMAIQPLFHSSNDFLPQAVFNLVFFGAALALSWNPNSIVDKLGKFLTPALIVLLAITVIVSVTSFTETPHAPMEPYDVNPTAAGLLEGYLTMDSIASLAFGIVVITALRYKGLPEGTPMVRGVTISGLIAGLLLAVVYVGLAFIGRVMPDAVSFDNGAKLLASASLETMGLPGQIIFGLVVLLACMTTAVGLIAATSEFFNALAPGISYKTWAVIFSVSSFLMASRGLDAVLAIAAPVIGFIYPAAITLIFLPLLEFKSPVPFRWAFRLPMWVSALYSAITSLVGLKFDALEPLVSWSLLYDSQLGWILPTVIALVIGLVIDTTRKKTTAQ